MAAQDDGNNSLSAIKVLVLQPWGYGGLIHYACCLCQALAEQEADVVLVTAREFECIDQVSGVRIINRLPIWKAVRERGHEGRLRRNLMKLVRGFQYACSMMMAFVIALGERPDVIHLMDLSFVLDLLFILPARLLGFKMVITCHNIRQFSYRAHSQAPSDAVLAEGRIWQHFRDLAYNCMDGVIFHNESNQKEYHRQYATGRFVETVIPHGAYDFFKGQGGHSKANAREELHLPPSAPVVLFFGVLRRYKGLTYLLQAFALFLEACPTARLVVAGAPLGDVDPEELKALARTLRIDHAVHWHLNYVPADYVSVFFAACDVVVLPYVRVYDSGVAKAAMAMGRPLIVTDTGGLREAVDDGRAGLVVPAADAAALAQAIAHLTADANLAEQLVHHGLMLSQTRYSWPAIARETLGFYAAVIRG